jgi:proline iminopeptidase
MPCWFVHGEGDPRPSSTVADLADEIPGAQMHVMAGAGHNLWRERPTEFQHLLRRLIRASWP